MRLVKLAAVMAGGVVVALAAAGVWVWSSASESNVCELEFANELRIPPLAEPSLDEPDRKLFDLRLEEGEAELLAGKPAETWGQRPLPGAHTARGAGRRGAQQRR